MRRMAMAAALAAALQLAAPACAMSAERGRPTLLAGPTVLSPGRTIVPLRSRPGLRLPRGGRATLVIEGLAFDAPPRLLYEVYLQTRSGRRALLGVINFYNQGAPAYGGVNAAAPGASSQSFDVTEALRILGGQPAALVFEPTSGVTGPAVRANAAARVRFASATIRLR